MARSFALITGASSGIGLELARVFAENGYDLIINSEDERLQEAASQLKNLGAQVTPSQSDLSTYDGVEELWRAAQATGVPLMLQPSMPASESTVTSPGKVISMQN